jgi:hypothetical protein
MSRFLEKLIKEKCGKKKDIYGELWIYKFF